VTHPNPPNYKNGHCWPKSDLTRWMSCPSSSKGAQHLLTVVPHKKTTHDKASEANAVSPCAAALSSSYLPNVVHASTPPAVRLHMPLVLRIYKAGSCACSSSVRSTRRGLRSTAQVQHEHAWRKTTDLWNRGSGHRGVVLPCGS
jgi:hypothetical protein